MIVHEPQLIHQEKNLILTAKFETKAGLLGWPEYLWYRFPEEYEPYISLQSDAFMLPALIGAMMTGQNLEVRGTVSPMLGHVIDEYQTALSVWQSQYLQRVSIKLDRIAALSAQPTAVAASFSGGVDSFFTMWRNLAPRQTDPAQQISHGIFVAGFDMPLSDQKNLDAAYGRYKNLFAELGLSLLWVEMNTQSLVNRHARFVMLYAPFLAGAVLSLGRLIKRFYFPSSLDIEGLLNIRIPSTNPWGDPMLSTDTTEIVHYGASYTRTQKQIEIVDWDLAHKNLRVCFYPGYAADQVNCGKCEKCLRSMLILYIMGALEKYSTFPKPFTHPIHMLRWARKYNPYSYANRSIGELIRQERKSWLPVYYLAVVVGWCMYWLRKGIPAGLQIRLDPKSNEIKTHPSPFDVPDVVAHIRRKPK